MDFLKKSGTYLVQHTKSEAVKALKNDDRVKSIKSRPFYMVIETNPLMTDGSFYPELSLEPVGRFVITIRYFKTNKRLTIKILRKEGDCSNHKTVNGHRHHTHIDRPNEYDKLCFGSAGSEIQKIQDNKDWYWAGVMCLNLLQDFTDHNFKTIKAIELMVVSQIQYMKKNKRFEEHIKKKTVEIIKNSETLMKVYNDEKYFLKKYGDKKYEYFIEID